METPDRIAKLFSDCKDKGRAAFVGYVCACDPDFNTSLEISRSLIDNGVDLLELGVPFSDPLADGLTNQLAAQRAWSPVVAKMRFSPGRGNQKIFRGADRFLHLLQLGVSQGVEEYVKRSQSAGVDGLYLGPSSRGSDRVGRGISCSRDKEYFCRRAHHARKRIPPVEARQVFYTRFPRRGYGRTQGFGRRFGQEGGAIRKFSDLPVVVGFGVSLPSRSVR